jgi:hypothetical protein
VASKNIVKKDVVVKNGTIKERISTTTTTTTNKKNSIESREGLDA